MEAKHWVEQNKMSTSENRACIPTLLRTVRSLPLPHPHRLHLDSLKLKMATWPAVWSHTELLQPATFSTRSYVWAAPQQIPECIILTKMFDFSWTKPARIFRKVREKQNSYDSPKAWSNLVIHQSGPVHQTPPYNLRLYDLSYQKRFLIIWEI